MRLELRDITKQFPGVLANDRISISVDRGQVLGLLGENGAGKTTLMNILSGLYKPDSNAKKSVADLLQEGVDGDIDENAVFEARTTMDIWLKKRVDANTMQDYQNEANVYSMDGLPGLKAARRGAGQKIWATDAKAMATRILAQYEALAVGFGLAVLLYAVLGLGLLIV